MAQQWNRHRGGNSQRHCCPCCGPWPWRGAYGGDRKRETAARDALIERIADDNRHPLVDWGPPVGREAW